MLRSGKIINRSNTLRKSLMIRRFSVMKKKENDETFVQLILQIIFPYFMSGICMIGAGAVLDRVKANLGAMDKPGGFWHLATGNIALTLCQALVVGLLVSLLAVFLSMPESGSHILLITSSCLITAFLSSALLGLLICLVVYLSRTVSINPDNLAASVAGSLGDLMTISMLAGIFRFLYSCMDTHWLNLYTILLLCLSLPLWSHICSSNEYSRDAFLNGWHPIICGVAISSLGGAILDKTITHFDGLARFQLLFNGIGGDLVAIHVSRLTTSLQGIGPLGTDIHLLSKDCLKGSFCQYRLGSKSAKALLMLLVPGHLIFLFLIWFCHRDDDVFLIETKNFTFAVLYLTASFLQVATLLYIAQNLVAWQWKRHLDPDTVCIPYLTAMGDLLGIVLLASAFHLHHIFHQGLL